MFSKFIGEKSCVAKAWRSSAKNILYRETFVSDKLPFIILTEIGDFKATQVPDEAVPHIMNKSIHDMIIAKGWQDFSMEEIADLIQMEHDLELDDIQEAMGQSQITIIQKLSLNEREASKSKRKCAPA